jgi:hypothetical protein
MVIWAARFSLPKNRGKATVRIAPAYSAAQTTPGTRPVARWRRMRRAEVMLSS